MIVLFSLLWIGASEHFHHCIIFFIMDLVNPFVYCMVFYLLARNESFHESGANIETVFNNFYSRLSTDQYLYL